MAVGWSFPPSILCRCGAWGSRGFFKGPSRRSLGAIIPLLAPSSCSSETSRTQNECIRYVSQLRCLFVVNTWAGRNARAHMLLLASIRYVSLFAKHISRIQRLRHCQRWCISLLSLDATFTFISRCWVPLINPREHFNIFTCQRYWSRNSNCIINRNYYFINVYIYEFLIG